MLRLLAPTCLLVTASAHVPGLTPAQIADKSRPAVVLLSADTAAGESVGSGFIVDPMGTVLTIGEAAADRCCPPTVGWWAC